MIYAILYTNEYTPSHNQYPPPHRTNPRPIAIGEASKGKQLKNKCEMKILYTLGFACEYIDIFITL